MKQRNPVWVAFGLLILIASLYRVWEGRPAGFTPQLAMAIFGGAVIRDKKWAFVVPVLSMFLSDALYQLLYVNGFSPMPGFYGGQVSNYLLIAGLTVFGFLLKRISALRVLGFSLGGSLLYFIASNFLVWSGGGGLGRPHTADGLLMCYNDALAFYRDRGAIEGFWGNIFLGDLFFAAVLFGTYYLVGKTVFNKEQHGQPA